MVNVKKGSFITCDPAMKQFLLHWDETLPAHEKFIIQDLDETHLFVSSESVETIRNKVDDLIDQISYTEKLM